MGPRKATVVPASPISPQFSDLCSVCRELPGRLHEGRKRSRSGKATITTVKFPAEAFINVSGESTGQFYILKIVSIEDALCPVIPPAPQYLVD